MIIKEITYINEGEVYRESERPMTGSSRIHNSHFVGSAVDGSGKTILSNYYNLSYPPPMIQYEWLSRKTNLDDNTAKIKKYYKTEYIAKKMGLSEWFDIPEGVDVCPAITTAVCVGILDDDPNTEFDLFFDIIDADNMQEVADYYGLRPPLKYDEAFTGGQHKWSIYKLNPSDVYLRDIKMGAIKFVDKKPTLFKYYRYVPS